MEAIRILDILMQKNAVYAQFPSTVRHNLLEQGVQQALKEPEEIITDDRAFIDKAATHTCRLSETINMALWCGLTVDFPSNSPATESLSFRRTRTPRTDLTFRIDQRGSYLQELDNLEPLLDTDRSAWEIGATRQTIWKNATPHNFYFPDRYVKDVTNSLGDNRFTESTSWNVITNAPGSEEKIQWRYETASDFYEGKNEIHFGMAKTAPEDSDALPLVRYSFISPNTAIIHAVQMPVIDGVLKGYMKSITENTNNEVAKIEKKLPTLEKSYGALIQKVLGIDLSLMTPETQLSSRDKITILWSMMLSNLQIATPDYANVSSALEKMLNNSTHTKSLSKREKAILTSFSQQLNRTALESQFVQYLEMTFAKRDEKISRVNTLFKKRKDTLSNSAPSGALLSLGTFCLLAHREGIRHLRIPTFIPLRQHNDYKGTKTPEEKKPVDTSILDQTVANVFGIAGEIDGITITKFPEDDTGEFWLTLEDTLSSSRPVFQSVIESLQK